MKNPTQARTSRIPSSFTGQSSIFRDPEARLVVGVLTVLGILVVMPSSGRAFGWLLAGLAVGVAWLASGIEGVRRRSRRRREVARAHAEWAELCRAIAAASHAGGSPAQVLQQRGYRDYELRKRIVQVIERNGDPVLLARE